MKKLIFTIVAFVLICKLVGAQTINVGVQDWGVPNTYLFDGKIKYDSNSGETSFNTSVKFRRFDASTQVRAQAIYVLDTNGSETAISDSIVVNTSDFTQASGIYWSKEFVKTAKLQPNNKNGIVKLKWRYLDTYSGTNVRWSGYQYASKTYQTIIIPTSAVAVYEYFSLTGTDHHFTTERNEDGNPYWQFQGEKFKAFVKQAPGTIPAYRYYSTSGTDHVILTDRTPALQNPSYWNQGGEVAFYVYPTAQNNTIPVHSYYHAHDRSHILAADAEMINYLKNTPGWEYQGIAFYALSK